LQRVTQSLLGPDGQREKRPRRRQRDAVGATRQGVDRFISSFRDVRQAVDLNMAAILFGTENEMHPPQTGTRSLILFVISLALVRTSISPRKIVVPL
jgi:hypothetical protein